MPSIQKQHRCRLARTHCCTVVFPLFLFHATHSPILLLHIAVPVLVTPPVYTACWTRFQVPVSRFEHPFAGPTFLLLIAFNGFRGLCSCLPPLPPLPRPPPPHLKEQRTKGTPSPTVPLLFFFAFAFAFASPLSELDVPSKRTVNSHMRRTSVSLPTKHVAHDPHEKPDRYGQARRQTGILEKFKDDMMSQAQKTRWFKTGAIVFIFLVALYYLRPSGVEISPECESSFLPSPLGMSSFSARCHADQFLPQHPRPAARFPPTPPMAPTNAPSPTPRTSPLCNMST